MKYINIAMLFFLAASLSGCEAIAAIFKTGVWTGVILVFIVIFGIVFLLSRRSKK